MACAGDSAHLEEVGQLQLGAGLRRALCVGTIGLIEEEEEGQDAEHGRFHELHR